MPTCPVCGSDLPDDSAVCPNCGAELGSGDGDADDPAAGDPEMGGLEATLMAENLDQEAERERFERRYGIDIGDRTVEEYLSHLDRQDYSTTPWFWGVVLFETAGVAAFVATVGLNTSLGIAPAVLFTASSVLLALAILGDTRAVGQFERWAKIRWTYVLSAAIPLLGCIMGAFYLTLRRLMHEETVEHRRRLVDEGVDIASVADD